MEFPCIACEEMSEGICFGVILALCAIIGIMTSNLHSLSKQCIDSNDDLEALENRIETLERKNFQSIVDKLEEFIAYNNEVLKIYNEKRTCKDATDADSSSPSPPQSTTNE